MFATVNSSSTRKIKTESLACITWDQMQVKSHKDMQSLSSKLKEMGLRFFFIFFCYGFDDEIFNCERSSLIAILKVSSDKQFKCGV